MKDKTSSYILLLALLAGAGLLVYLSYSNRKNIKLKQEPKKLKKTNRKKVSLLSTVNLWSEDFLLSEIDLDLFAGMPAYQEQYVKRYNPMVPITAFNKDRHAPIGPLLDVSRLPKTDVIDVVERKYIPDRKSGFDAMREIRPLSEAITNIEKNVCSVCYGIGQPMGTGLVIAPDLVLVARHCIENINLSLLNMRLNYQKTRWGLDYGCPHQVTGVVEENEELDFAIVKLEHPISNFQPPTLRFINSFSGSSVLVHHPDGSPKKVSVHAHVESNNKQISASSFHDSWEGSSGAIYTDEQGKVFAMHLLHDGKKTNASWLKDIYSNSPCLRTLFAENGTPKHLSYQEEFVANPIKYLPETNKSCVFHLEKKTPAPREMPRLDDFPWPYNNGDPIHQSRHHIIPAGDMQFLWLMAQECRHLKNTLSQMGYAGYEDDRDLEKMNAVEWAPWNLFIGPSGNYRIDDPNGLVEHDPMGDAEQTCPSSFDDCLWNKLIELHGLIRNCWQCRYNLATQLKRSDGVKSVANYRNASIEGSSGVTALADKYFDSTDITEDNLCKTRQSAPKKQYLGSMKNLINCLSWIRNFYRMKYGCGFDHVHETQLSDWKTSSNGMLYLKNADLRRFNYGQQNSKSPTR